MVGKQEQSTVLLQRIVHCVILSHHGSILSSHEGQILLQLNSLKKVNEIDKFMRITNQLHKINMVGVL